jgi:hypothetical protein
LDKDIQYDVLGQKTGQLRNVTNVSKLNAIITKSLSDYPRDYLLVDQKGSPLDFNDNQKKGSASTYNAILKKWSKKALHQGLLRKIFVYWWYRQNRIDYATMEKIAEYMRHDVTTAVSDYLKVNVPEYVGKPIEVYVPPLPKTIEAPPKEKEYFNPKEYGKVYREKNKEKLKEKRKDNYKDKDGHYTTDKGKKVLARKMLWYLNTGGTAKPKQSSIDTYKLKYDEEKEIWTSDGVE